MHAARLVGGSSSLLPDGARYLACRKRGQRRRPARLRRSDRSAFSRLLIGSDYRFLLPASVLLGAAVVTFCDTLARLMFAPLELPVGIMMGALGAPFFLYLLRREAR